MDVPEQRVRPNTLTVIIQMASPVFILVVVVVPIGALIYALNFGPLVALNYVHVMTGGLWTGIDLFMGFVLGPVLGRMNPPERVAVFKHLIPRMTFLMPVLATVTIMAGIELANRLGFPLENPRIIAAYVVSGLLAAQGFGLLLPNEIRVFQQLLSERPDVEKVARLGMLNAKLGGVQGVFQLAVIFVMATLRF
ncbi:MAG: hypothetical protein HYX88_04165 [Chloroflexi bacterium]|nr:hypothetical protein [Chloroflexota bacterium]